MVLTTDETDVLDRIIKSRKAWVARSKFVAKIVERLQDLGLIASWAFDRMGKTLQGGPYVTLTPLGAELRGVTLIEWREGYPRWGSLKRALERERHHHPIRAKVWVGMHLMTFNELTMIPDNHEKPILKNEDGDPIKLFNGYTILIDPRLTMRKRMR